MRVLVSSLQPETAETLRNLVREIDGQHAVDVVLRAGKTRRASDSPDLVLLDVDGSAPRNAGALVRQIVQDHPDTRIVATGSRSDDAFVKNILKLGVLGYLPMTQSRTVSLGLLRLAFGGARNGDSGATAKAEPQPSST